MSALFWFDLAGYIIAAVLATSLALTVLPLGPKHTLNRLFALFTLTEASSALSSLVLRMELWLQMGNPSF